MELHLIMEKKSNNLSAAFWGNIITSVLVLLSSIWMFSGWHIGSAPSNLEGQRLAMFKFYTVDSNVLMGVIALVVAIVQFFVFKGKIKGLPVWVPVIKLVGVVGVTLTMLVTIFFLTPTMGFYTCFNNSNLFLHFVNPVVSIITFLWLEKCFSIKFIHTFTGVCSMVIYTVYYVAVSVAHSSNNVVAEGYDWYGFFALGLKSGFVIVPLLILITYIISLGLWAINRKFK